MSQNSSTPTAAEAAAAMKRRRETESQGSDTNHTPGPTPAARQGSTAGANKRLKEGVDATAASGVNKPRAQVKKTSSGIPDPVGKGPAGPAATAKKLGSEVLGNTQVGGQTTTTAISISDDEGSPVPSDGEVPVSAVKARARTSAQLAGVNVNNSRRARFAQKYAGLTPEQTLKRISEGWHSNLYDHYKKPIIVSGANGAVVHRFVCKKHPSKHVDRMEYQDSTGNLARHVKLCDPDDTPEVEQITAYAHGATYSPERLRFLIAMWCARRHRPFTIVEDPEFQEIVRMLYNKAKIPSRVTVSRDVRAIFNNTKDRVRKMFKDYPGKIHICLDGWTSPNVISFLGVTAHWHQEGEIQHIILEFIQLSSAHTAKYIAAKLVDCLKDYGIEEKVLAVTCDNASTNTAMMRDIKDLVPTSYGPQGRVRCFGHILSLVVKAIMSQFVRRRGKAVPADVAALDDPEDEDIEDQEAAQEADESREAADDDTIDELEEDHPDLVLSEDDILFGQLAVEKITKLSQKVWHSPQIRGELARLAAEANLNSQVLLRSVKTRWNTMTMVLERALEMREVLTDLCDMHQFNRAGGARLRRFILSAEEWLLLEQLYRLLDPFLYATTEISSSTRGLVHEVIPFIDVLTKHVDDFAENANLLASVRAAAGRGRILLDSYYSKTDETAIYRIAMMLSPAFKDQYFRKAGWPEDWIAEARALIREEWISRYKPTAEPVESASSSSRSRPSASASRTRPGHMSAKSAKPSATRDMFANVGGRKGRNNQDALEEYLEAPPRATVLDPLAYWQAALASNSEDAALAQMALDYLSIPATSVDAERAFSRGRLTVSRLRHSLSDESVRANTVLGSWARIPGLVPEKEVISFLGGKKGKAVARDDDDATEPEVGLVPSDDEAITASSAAADEDDFDDLYA